MRQSLTRPLFLLVAAFALWSLFPPSPLAQTVSFVDAERDFAAGTSPDSVAVGDFNGDGRLDVAVANWNSNDVSVLLGNGDGRFQTQRRFAAGGSPLAIAAGDFNGDGSLDLVVTNGLSTTVSVLLGQGDGTFQAPLTSFASDRFNSPPRWMVVSDFNGDGKLDLAVIDDRAYTPILVLLGNGDGTFQAPLTIPCPWARCAIAVGDLNGDGTPDLVVSAWITCCEYPEWVHHTKFFVLLGQGDGTFQAPIAVGTFDRKGLSAVVGDFDGDGTVDLMVLPDTWEYPGQPTPVSLLRGRGDGTFQAPQALTAAGSMVAPVYAAVGDFNGDGKLDLAMSIYCCTPTPVSDGFVVLLGNGDGTFQRPSTPVAVGGFRAAVGDFNGDGKLDLAVANGPSDTVSVALGKGDGTFLAPQTFDVGINPNSVAVGDFNGDGTPDLAVATYDAHRFGSPGDVSVLLGNGDGTFQAQLTFPAGTTPFSVIAGDFNGDGTPDLAVLNPSTVYPPSSGTVSVLLGNGDGTFQAPLASDAGGPLSYPFPVVAGDFNGDGKLDLAVSTASQSSGTVSVLLGNGDGTFQAPIAVASRPCVSLAVGDFNGDGKLDLAASQSSGTVSVLLGNGDGTFQALVTVGSVYNPASVAVGDFNGDGTLDLVALGSGDYYEKIPGVVSVLLGQGDGTFQAPLTSPAGLGPAYMAVGDFNGDGVADVAVTSGANAVSVLQGNGDGTFQAPLMFAAGFGAVAIAVSDFNDDGTPDLAVADWGLNNVSVLINNTPWPCHRHGRHCRGHRDLTWFRGPLTPWAPGVLDGREDTPTLPTGVSASDGPPGARGSEAGGT